MLHRVGVIREAEKLVSLPVVRSPAKTSHMCHTLKTHSDAHSTTHFEGLDQGRTCGTTIGCRTKRIDVAFCDMFGTFCTETKSNSRPQQNAFQCRIVCRT